MSPRPLALALGGPLVLALAITPVAGREAPGAAEGWREFAGTWSATGRRQAVAIEGGGRAVIVEVEGAVVLSGGDVLSRGFVGQAIGYDDGAGRNTGRCVWTDPNGDRLFSRLEGQPLETGRRFVGTITGGTGRYAGLEGEYSLIWQYVVASEPDRIQGRAVGLSGRIRRAEPRR